MRFHILGLALLAGTAMPAIAQSNDRIERRVERLERDLQSMQRRVATGTVQPEIRPAVPNEIGGIPATSAIADLTARMDALERQIATITGAAEENAHRLRQAEAALAQYRRDAELRAQEAPAPVKQVEAAPPAAEAAPASEPKTLASSNTVNSGDPAEDAYLVGFRQWEAGDFASAQKSLEAAAKKYPKHRRASYSLNLAGRAYLDDGKPATAAKLLLSNYQVNPKGERAADSLYFLGTALLKLKKPVEACRVFDELQEVYPTMRDWVKQRLPEARAEAKCK